MHFGFTEATGGHGWSTETDTGRTERGAFVGGEGISVQSKADFVEGVFVEFAVNTTATLNVDEDEVVFGAVALENKVVGFEVVGESPSVFDDIFGVSVETWLKGLTESDGFGGDNVFKRTALSAGEDSTVNQGGEIVDGVVDFVKWVRDSTHGHDEAATWATQGLVGGGGHDMKTVFKRIFVNAASDESGDVCHVSH